MKRAILLSLFLIFVIAVGIFSTVPVTAQKRKVVAFDLTPGRVKDIDSEKWQASLKALEANLTAWGYDVKEITKITPDALKGVDALVIGKMKDYKSGFSPDEVKAIADWFKQGGKFLWVGSDSDYVEPYLNPEDTSFKAGEPNKILEAIGSSIRVEYASLEDPESNAGAGYRVVSYRANTQGWAGEITKGAPKVLFHGPSLLAGYKDGNFVPFDEVVSDTCQWLYRSSDKGTVVSHDGVDPKAYKVGDTGSFVEAAAEKIPVGASYSKVIVTSESLYGDRNIFSTEYHGVKLNGPTFVKNAFAWGTTVESAGLPMEWLAGIVVIIVVILIVAYLFLKRKK